MSKLTEEYQKRWKEHNLYDPTMFFKIKKEHLHEGIDNVMSSAIACLNVFGILSENHDSLIRFLNCFDIQVQEIIPFPQNANIGGEIYDDSTSIIFEWIGPKKSPIYEKGGTRGKYKTSIDTFILARIHDKITQVLIEWKFTEAYTTEKQFQEFAGTRGIERLRRYSSVLSKLRQNMEEFPFNMSEDGGWGLYDLGYEPFYQLLRMTLLAKTTTPIIIADHITVEDYRIVHLSHSENTKLNNVTSKQLRYCPGFKHFANQELHEIWSKNILTEHEAQRFKYGYWNQYLDMVSDEQVKSYLKERYE